jgi:phage major head subunit gpT-like protein
MATITRSSLPALLDKGINRNFGDGYRSYESVYPQLYEVIDVNDGNREHYQEVGGLGSSKLKAEGEKAYKDTVRQGYEVTIKHDVYALTYEITFEQKSDNRYQEVLNRMLDLGRSQAETREILGADLFNKAFAASSYDFPTGQTVCGTAQKTLIGTTFANKGTAGSLSEDNLNLAFDDIRKFRQPNGFRMNAKPIALVVPPKLAHKADVLLNSTHKPEFGTNIFGHAVNTARKGGSSYLPSGVIVNNYFTSDTAWFLLTDQKGLVFHNRTSPFIEKKIETEQASTLVTSLQRFSNGIYDPRAIYGNAGA